MKQSLTRVILDVEVPPRRMLKKAEAALYCRRPLSVFEREFPFKPIKFPNGDLRYDMHDLDTWLNSLKSDAQDLDIDAMIERLK